MDEQQAGHAPLGEHISDRRVTVITSLTVDPGAQDRLVALILQRPFGLSDFQPITDCTARLREEISFQFKRFSDFDCDIVADGFAHDVTEIARRNEIDAAHGCRQFRPSARGR